MFSRISPGSSPSLLALGENSAWQAKLGNGATLSHVTATVLLMDG